MLLCLALGGCATVHAKETSLDSLLAITDPDTCELSSEFDRFYDSFFSQELKAGSPTAPKGYESAFGKAEYVQQPDGSWDMRIPVKGSWKAFPLVEIRSTAPVGGDPWSIFFILKAPYESVSSRLDEDGLSVNENGHAIMDSPDMVYTIGRYLLRVENDPDRVEFGCIWF